MWSAFAQIDMQLLLAGIFGGVVHAIHVRRIGPWEVIGYIVAGGLIANYFTMLVLSMMASLMSAPSSATGPVAFGLGYGAFRLCRFADRYLDKKLQLFERPENE